MSNFNVNALGAISKALYEAILIAFPKLPFEVAMSPFHEKDGQSITMRLSSPTGNADRDMMVWVDEFPSPSLEFGHSHCHEPADENGYNAIVDMIRLIVADVLVLITEKDDKGPKYVRWLNISEPNTLLDELTDPFSSGQIFIETWTGSIDREVSLSDI